MKLDYSITGAQERLNYINNLISAYPVLSARDKEKIADYLVFSTPVEDREVLTDNRMVTINKRETSFQGLSDKLEGGEDAVLALVRQDKQTILSPKKSISQADLEDMPELAALRQRIEALELELAKGGSPKFKLKKALIEMRKEQYSIKQCYRQPVYARSPQAYQEQPHLSDIKLSNPEHVVAILANYIKIKQSLWDNLKSDLRWIMLDLENLIETYLRPRNPMYYDILVMKVEGATNDEIQHALQLKHGRAHSQEYISSLWKNRIPELLADAAKEDFLEWVFLSKIRGTYKTCSRCGQTKLAHRRYFSTNKAARYGFYSVCKECRNDKVLD